MVAVEAHREILLLKIQTEALAVAALLQQETRDPVLTQYNWVVILGQRNGVELPFKIT
jgi:hypothetical protein